MRRSSDRQKLWEFMAELTALPLTKGRMKLSAFAREHDIPDAFAGADAMREEAERGRRYVDAARMTGLRSDHESRITSLERRIADLEARVAELERKR